MQADLCLCDPVVEGVAGAIEVEDVLGAGAVEGGVAGAIEVEDVLGARTVGEGVLCVTTRPGDEDTEMMVQVQLRELVSQTRLVKIR